MLAADHSGARTLPGRCCSCQSAMCLRSQPISARPPSLRRALRLNAAAAAEQGQAVPIPSSQEAAVEAAVSSLRPFISATSSSKPAKKGFDKTRRSGGRLCVEIPVADASPASCAALAGAIVGKLDAACRTRTRIVYANADAARVKRAPLILDLQQACREASLSGPLALVNPRVEDLALVDQLLDEVWSGPHVVMINPEWTTRVPQEYSSLVDSFEVVYSFLPCEIKGLVGNKEGAVVRTVTDGKPEDALWRVLYRSGQDFVQVAQMKRRPTATDLELAFMNASAASSPLTRTVKFFKSLVPGGKKQ